MLEFQIMTMDNETAIEVSNLLKRIGITKGASDIFYEECLIAINGDDEIIAFAENISPKKEINRAEIFYFQKLSRKQKSRIKVSFFNIIFSRKFWRKNKNFGNFREKITQGREYAIY